MTETKNMGSDRLKDNVSILSYLLVIAMISFPILGYLSVLPIRDFDEARNALNALEMVKNGDLIVTHFEGKPDMWNTKPPLMIWIQVVCIRIFGPGEFAVRLPSAIAALLTCIFILFLCARYFKNTVFGMIWVLVLVTSNGFVNFHSSRTGDYDALLTLFICVYSFAWFVYLETSKGRYLTYFFLALTLSILTKGIAGLFFIPGLFLYTLLKKKILAVMLNRKIYAGLFISIGTVLAYYFLRENANPGYIKAVWENELGGRYMTVIENNQGGFWFYFNNLISSRLEFWYLLVPLGIVAGVLSKDEKMKRVAFFATVISATFILIISSAKTKCYWYDLPLFPFLAMLVSIPLVIILTLKPKNVFEKYKTVFRILGIAVVVLLFYEPARKTLGRTINPKEQTWDIEKYEVGHLLQDAVKGKADLGNYFLLHEGYSGQNLFYIKLLNEKGVRIALGEIDSLSIGDSVLVHQKLVLGRLEKKFEMQKLFTRNNVEGYQIEGLKE